MEIKPPQAGLDHIRSQWSGRGTLIEALATLDPDQLWSPEDVRRRLNRVLLGLVRDQVAALPRSARRWDEALPAETVVRRLTAAVPAGRVDYVRTRLAGWPPQSFVVRQRSRIPEELLTAATAWTLCRLGQVARDAKLLGSEDPKQLAPQLDAARAALELPTLSDVDRVQPHPADLVALRRAGRPWVQVAALATAFCEAQDPTSDLFYRMILPDPTLAGRLFQLAVTGEVLIGATRARNPLASYRPLGMMGTGPQFASRRELGPNLWMEAGGMWTARGIDSPYERALAGLPGAGGRPRSPDVLLEWGRRALILECKFSDHPSVIADGYAQVLAYAAELRLQLFDEVTTVVVAPDQIIERGQAETHVGRVMAAPAGEVSAIVTEWLTESATLQGSIPAIS